MKKIILPCAFLLFLLLIRCQNTNSRQSNATNNANSASGMNADSDLRAKSEIVFLNRVKAESDYSVTSNAIKKDSHIIAFNKYAIDSLKKIADWELIVTEINDNKADANSFSQSILDLTNNDCYNLVLVAPIKIDRSVDTIAIENSVDFTYTLLKQPKNVTVEKQLSLIKTLSKGDTVIVSGAITHIDDKLKVNFASFYDSYLPWNVDLLVTDIRKKTLK